MSDATARPVLLVLASTYPRWPGDPEPGFVHELARRLTDTFRVIALVPSAPGAPRRELMDGVEVERFRYAPRGLETLVNDGGIVTNLKRHRWKWLLVPLFGLSQTWHAWRLSSRAGVDLVHAHWLVPQGLVAVLLRSLPGRSPGFVVTSHGADLFALRGHLFNRLKRMVVRRADAVTVVSREMRSELERLGAADDSVRVQPMGVDLQERFVPAEGVTRSRDEILFVGRLVEKKGLRHLIDAMPAILAQRESARLTVVGFGPELDERRAQVSQLGLGDAVVFAGPVAQADLPGIYRRAAVFVAPFVQASSGDQEGLGLVVVEAAGCGCPVVVSDLPAVRDVFLAQAPAGLVAPGSPEALAEAVTRVLANPPPEGLLRADLVARFDWRAVADAYTGILSAALSARPGR